MKLLSSEWLKTRHTLIRWLIFFLPIFMSACIIIYLANRNSIAIDTIYQTYFIICSWFTVSVTNALSARNILFLTIKILPIYANEASQTIWTVCHRTKRVTGGGNSV